MKNVCLLIIILTSTLITNDLDIAEKNALLQVKDISEYILASSLLKFCYTLIHIIYKLYAYVHA